VSVFEREENWINQEVDRILAESVDRISLDHPLPVGYHGRFDVLSVSDIKMLDAIGIESLSRWHLEYLAARDIAPTAEPVKIPNGI
jgi:hypothetical protein